MDFKLPIVLIAVLVITVQAAVKDKGPQTFTTESPNTTTVKTSNATEKTTEKPKLLKRQELYEMRDAIVYLTPSQIKALEEGKGILRTKNDGQVEFTNEIPQEQQPEPNLEEKYQPAPEEQPEVLANLENHQHQSDNIISNDPGYYTISPEQLEELLKQQEAQEQQEIQKLALQEENTAREEYENDRRQKELQFLYSIQKHFNNLNAQNQPEPPVTPAPIEEPTTDAVVTFGPAVTPKPQEVRYVAPGAKSTNEERPESLPETRTPAPLLATAATLTPFDKLHNHVHVQFFFPQQLKDQALIVTPRPLEIQQELEIQKPNEIQKPVEAERPLEIQRQIEAQNPAEVQRPVEVQRLVEVQRPIEAQRPVEIQRVEVLKPYIVRPIALQRPVESQKPLEIQKDPLFGKEYRLVPNGYLSTKKQPISQTQVQKLHYELQNLPRSQPADTVENYLNQLNKPENKTTEPTPQTNSDKYIAAFEKELKKYEEQKKKSQEQIESIANSGPIFFQKELKLAKPVHVIKPVGVPVPSPVFVPVPHPYEVKVPQPYPVPLEIIRHVPYPIVKTETVEVEKPVPYEVIKHVPVPTEKKVYIKVDKPITVEKLLPIDNLRREKLTLIKHIWDN